MPRDAAETLAARALAWLAGEPERLGRFLAETGADAGDLRARAADPDFLGFVLDFLLADEDALLACAEALAMPPEDAVRARAGLPGGDLPHWT
jgi:hypothetical protein